MTGVPDWGRALLVAAAGIEQPAGAYVDDGIIRLPIAQPDRNITYYRSIGGSHFHERSSVAFAMSALDTPIYHSYLDDVQPPALDDVIVDIGGGDGRNTLPWLERGYRRVVIVDAVADSLRRLRTRIEERSPGWLERIVFIECDARALPLRDGCAAAVVAIESLCYLTADYEVGVRECARILAAGGKLLVSERDYEGTLLTRLLYAGTAGCLELAESKISRDGGGPAGSRVFGQAELAAALERNGFATLSVRGVSLLSVVLGWLNANGMLAEDDRQRLPEVQALLAQLAAGSTLRRCNVFIAARTA